MLPCDICGKAGHSWFDCPKRSTMPVGWKPERLMIYGGGRKVGKTAFQRMAIATVIPAGPIADAMIDAAKAEEAMMQKSIEAPVFAKRAPGRQKSIDDMRAYKAAKQREYRAKRQEEGK